MNLRDYQKNAITRLIQQIKAGNRRPCLVMPTGAGKTVTGAHFVLRAMRPTIWVAHRTELIDQAAGALERVLREPVGIIRPGQAPRPEALVQVASVQTLLARGTPHAAMLVLDEAHHYVSEQWSGIMRRFSHDTITLGLTATPERADGRPLSHIFNALVVGCTYTRLLNDRALVPCRVYRPPHIDPEGRPVKLCPVSAYKRYTPHGRAFCFMSTRAEAEAAAAKFCVNGVAAEAVDSSSGWEARAGALERFKRGETAVLCNVGLYTEGTDVPAADVVILARACKSLGLYMQICGRVLRPYPGKRDAALLDLVGASVAHGLPTDEREYRLEGAAGVLPAAGVGSVTTCPECFACYATGARACPACGWFKPAPDGVDLRRIEDFELKEVYAGAATEETARSAWVARAVQRARDEGRGMAWVVRAYRELFEASPDLKRYVTRADKSAEYESLLNYARDHGYRAGWAAHRYRDIFGVWPRGVKP